MGVDYRVVRWLRDQGYDAVHLRDEGMQCAPNGEMFSKATLEGRFVLTFDLDFGEIAALTKGRKASVILFRLRNTRKEHVIARLGTVLGGCSPFLGKGGGSYRRRCTSSDSPFADRDEESNL